MPDKRANACWGGLCKSRRRGGGGGDLQCAAESPTIRYSPRAIEMNKNLAVLHLLGNSGAGWAARRSAVAGGEVALHLHHSNEAALA